MKIKKVRFDSDKEKQNFFKYIEVNPDFELVREKIRISVQMDKMINESRGLRFNELAKNSDEMWRISNEVKKAIDLLELCNFTRLIAVMYQQNPNLILTLNRNEAQGMNYTTAEYVTSGIGSEVVSTSMYINLNEQGLDNSIIEVIGESKYEHLLHQWGNKAKVWLDRQGMGYKFSMFPRNEDYDNEDPIKRTKAGKSLDIKERMVILISGMLVQQGGFVSKEQREKCIAIYDNISASAARHMFLAENRNEFGVVKGKKALAL